MAKKKKIKIDPNLIIALGVLIASFAALFVYIKQTSIMTKQTEILVEQSKANAWPRLNIGRNTVFENETMSTLSITISNKGTGPAIIENVIIKFDDQPVSNWIELHQKMKVPDSIPVFYAYSNISGEVITANEEFEFIDWNANKKIMNYIYKNFKKISIQICYKSVFDDYWYVEQKGHNRDIRYQVESCDSDEVTKFLQ